MDTERAETFAQLMHRLMDDYGVNESQIARAIGLNVGTVYTWTSGKRGGKRGPRPATLLALHKAYPKFTEAEINAAVGRQAPGPLDPDAEKRVLELYRGLTAEQQRMKLIELAALNEANQTGN